jgi:peptide/nickel transport system substrate-binding protein
VCKSIEERVEIKAMNTRSRLIIPISLVAAAVTVLSACSSSGGGGGNTNANTAPNSTAAQTGGGSGSSSGSSSNVKTASPAYNAAFDAIVNPSTKTGGTMNLISSADCDSWDPQRTYYGWCWNMQRLFTRSLMGYKVLNGDKFEITNDLATNMGTHNADYSEWTYTLKPGLKYSNGAPITAADIPWGISRLWATDVINGGPASYFLDGIKAPAKYRGVYKDGPNTVGMTVTGTNKITFHLTGPNADFDYLLSMAASAPVPAKTEGGAGYVGATYTKKPLSSGPFMIQSYTPKKQITFVRNPNWSQSSDTIHKPLVDKVVLTIDTSPTDLDQKLKSGQADGNASQWADPALQTWILTNPNNKKNADDPVSAFTRYLSVMPSVIPNVHCRRAIFYALDKAGFLRAYGGAVSGVVSGSMTPPGIEGNDPSVNPYPSGSGNNGNVAKAKEELKACGKPNGFSTKFAYSTPATNAKAAFTASQQSLAKVGIKISPITDDASTYYTTFIGSPSNIKRQGIGIAIAGWGADFPTAVGFWNSIANGKNIPATGNTNYPSLNDPVVNEVLDNGPSGKSTEADWKKLDAQVMTDAVYVPVYWGKNLYYRAPRLTNITCDNALAFGIYDWVNAGVSG